ncbi:MAG: TlpA family protein disulfide reductase [Syntrophobacteraceae bacterium]
MRKRFLRSLQFLACLFLGLSCSIVYSFPDQPIPAGSQLGRFTLPAPESQQVLSYLGLKKMEPYSVAQIDAKLVLIEVLSALCPHCHTNAPLVNKLYRVIQKDAALARDVKIIGICSGNDKSQTDAFRKNFKVPFPLIPDLDCDIAQAVGATQTPTLILVSHSGKVLMSHVGVIQDLDGLLKDLREKHKKL